ncbi:hypothetical protein GWO13_03255 [Candidatus Bathyarchaeota archaeon]|nr:hypothetical protein [Candidatus Bathyarchaeota archaeon]
MDTEIISANMYVQSLKDKFESLDIPVYKLRAWFSTTHQVFFDCESEDKVSCLEKLLKQRNFEAFTIFFVVKEPSGVFKFMDANFRNIGNETLEHFINRFHKQLESMTILSVQTVGLEYVECIGHSYHDLESGA